MSEEQRRKELILLKCYGLIPSIDGEIEEIKTVIKYGKNYLNGEYGCKRTVNFAYEIRPILLQAIKEKKNDKNYSTWIEVLEKINKLEKEMNKLGMEC